MSFRFEISLESSRWIVASAQCANGAVAHSSPIYVTVDGQPTWSASRGPAAIAKQLAAIRRIEMEFQSRADASHRAGILARLERAREYYARLKERMEQE